MKKNTAAQSAMVIIGSVLLGAGFLAGCRGPQARQAPLASQARPDPFEVEKDRDPTPQTLYAMAQLLAAQGKDAEAEWLLKRVISRHERFIPAYCTLAEVQVHMQRTDDAIRTLNAGLRTAPANPVVHNNLGMCYLIKGEYEKALQSFAQAAGIMPHNARYRSNMAVALGLMGRDEECLSLYEQVVPPEAAQANLLLLRRAAQKAQEQ